MSKARRPNQSHESDISHLIAIVYENTIFFVGTFERRPSTWTPLHGAGFPALIGPGLGIGIKRPSPFPVPLVFLPEPDVIATV